MLVFQDRLFLIKRIKSATAPPAVQAETDLAAVPDGEKQGHCNRLFSKVPPTLSRCFISANGEYMSNIMVAMADMREIPYIHLSPLLGTEFQ